MRVDFQAVRAAVTLAQVLDFIAFVPSERRGDQLRGPCPIHGSTSTKSRSFSVNLNKSAFRCFQCGASGNHLDLWAAVNGMDLQTAARTICERAGVAVPDLGSTKRTRSRDARARTEKR
ncbi:MAG: hypothetical protein HY000_29215, partial [Planctomycetes bacterium]|nr:hypothetical protein [Planctomycetota bacterium]